MHFHSFGISPYFSAESAALASCGGALLGLTVIFKTLYTGRVLGISGSTRGLLANWRSVDRAAFLLGLLLAGPFMASAYGGLEPMPPVSSSQGRLVLCLRLLFGGVLVGVGTAYASGCTSGHGLTGLARLTKRSWLAVPTFMGSGIVAATLTQVSSALPPDARTEASLPSTFAGLAAAAAGVMGLLVCGSLVLGMRGRMEAWKLPVFVELASGAAFGCGLVVSGMARPSKVAGFLDLGSGAWDPSLPFVMASALFLTFPFFQVLQCKNAEKPLICEAFELPPKTNSPDRSLIIGSVVFGLGWGVCGACPGPIWVLVLSRPSLEIALLWLGMLLGLSVWVFVGKQSQKVAKARETIVVCSHLETNCRSPLLNDTTSSEEETESAEESSSSSAP